MKKIFYVIILSLLVGCAVMPRPREVLHFNYDFREYSEQGFFISPNPYIGEYKPLGLIKIEVFPGQVKELNNESENKLDTPYISKNSTFYVDEEIRTDELLDILVKQAKNMGANGIVNFKAYEDFIVSFHKGVKYSRFEKYRLEGFAIFRNN
ncbi:hypothetical protein ACUNWD_06340 [Sunxiuqinia sp. A32]|uniref:hypothetical protein n=1 Tax=Sunxiuqinia sp. A32 TaxID=3461496 RepID=UPI0040463787